MNFAIISAGEGSRLVAEGIDIPKPLVSIGGTTLIDRLINIFVGNGASSISVIVNSENLRTIAHMQHQHLDVPLNLMVKSTPGSMHSLYELKPFLHDAPFCLTTVDTVFRESEFVNYLNAFCADKSIDGLMAVTDFVDDEKPLYIEVDDSMQIINFCDESTTMNKYISGGIYCLRPAVWQVLDTAMQSGMTRMRDFQRQLIQKGLKIKAFPFSKIVDIDHASDISIAENFLTLNPVENMILSWTKILACIDRDDLSDSVVRVVSTETKKK